MKGVEELKKIAGVSACNYVQDGMILGLGTGSTVKYTILEIGRKIREENLQVVGVPTSLQTKKLAEMLEIPLIKIDEINTIDLTIDGTDEFDNSFNLIKGGGGALTREKIVAKASNSMVVVADSSKHVETLGLFPLPIEVNQDKWHEIKRKIRKLERGKYSRDKPRLKKNRAASLANADLLFLSPNSKGNKKFCDLRAAEPFSS